MKKKKAPQLPLIILISLPAILLVGGLFLCFHTSGFSTSKMGSNLLFNNNWEVEPLTEKQQEQLLKEVFPQTYYFERSETHCYVFISEDKNYALKFFKTKSLSPKEWWAHYPLSGLHYLGFNYQFDNQFLSEHIFSNYRNVYESLFSESGLIHIHLNRSEEFNTQVHLIDGKGKKHLIDVDSFEFILQKKGVPLLKYLESLAHTQQLSILKSSIRSFLRLVAVRCEKGFACQDVALNDHYGFVGTQPVFFDCGILTKDSSMQYPLNIQKEVLKAAERLNVWANEHCPEVTFLIQEEAAQVINQIF